MSYDYPPYRPPNEANSALIRLTHGCPWNRCEFCSMYKKTKFKSRPLEEIQEDIRTARTIYGASPSIFLGDSDNLVHKNLPEILDLIRASFPETRRITAYARAKTILSRKEDFLRRCREAGLDRLHIGLESGDETILKELNKGVEPDEVVKAGLKAHDAGFELSFYVLSGAGGLNRWKEHAVNSARALNKINPEYIRLRTLTVLRGTSLFERIEKGEFEVTPPLDRLRELLLFLEELDVNNCFLASDHVTNYLWIENIPFFQGVNGSLPEDKETMLKTIQKAVEIVLDSHADVKDSNQLYREGHLSQL
ncbi:radical SAM protein [Acidobacteriota bacterium]